MASLMKTIMATAGLIALAVTVPTLAFLASSKHNLDRSNYSFKVEASASMDTYAFDDKHNGQINRIVEFGFTPIFREYGISICLPAVVTTTSNDEDFQAKLVQVQSLRGAQ